MRDTVYALMMRELKTRFGSNKLGYFWALAEPALQVLIMALLFSLIGKSTLTGIPVALFILPGIMPFRYLSKTLPFLVLAIRANKALLAYKQVHPIDPLISRKLVDCSVYFMVYMILTMGFLWFGFEAIPSDLIALILVNILLLFLVFGLGMILCVANVYWEDVNKVVSMSMRPLFFVSGVLFCITMIPSEYWYLLTWNPLLHIIEISREAYFSAYESPVGDWYYVLKWTLGVNAFGLILLYTSRKKFVSL